MGKGTSPGTFAEELLHEFRVPLALAGISASCIVLSILLFLKSLNTAEPIVFSDGRESSGSGVMAGALTVDVAGAVRQPGVYRLDQNARVNDAIQAAGGLAGDADRDSISRLVNLASRLSDGAKLYIPRSGEGENDTTSHKNSFTTSQEVTSRTDGILGVSDVSQNEPDSARININSASQSELETLNGVGPVIAGKIVGNRPYTDLNQLVEKKVMSASLFQKLAGQLSL